MSAGRCAIPMPTRSACPTRACKILYEVLNERDGVLAERYLLRLARPRGPHARARRPPVHRGRTTARSARSTCSASVFSTEMGYTNLLTILDLAGIRFSHQNGLCVTLW